MKPIKLIHLNIWLGRLTPAILRFIEAEQPDILCMQEVLRTDADVMFPDKQFNSLQLIQEQSRLEHSFFSPLWRMDIANGTAEMGNTILSRFPVRNQRTIFTNGEFTEHHTALNHIPNTRNLQISMLNIDSRTLNVLNHHAHWEKTPLGSATSVEKMKIVRDEAAKLEGPTIIAGDMNVSPESDAMRVFDGVLDDLIAHTNTKSTLSGLGVPFDVVCDHILVNNEIDIINFTAREDVAISDHVPLVIEFLLKDS